MPATEGVSSRPAGRTRQGLDRAAARNDEAGTRKSGPVERVRFGFVVRTIRIGGAQVTNSEPLPEPEPSTPRTKAEVAVERAQEGSLRPDMPRAQVEWLRDSMRGARGYLEFGCGGSTLLAAEAVQGPVLGVESSREWIEGLSDNIVIRRRLNDGSLRLHHADVGPTGPWGRPMGRVGWQMGFSYAMEPLQRLDDQTRDKIELVLVDGRFRVASCLAAAVYLPNVARVLVDDYEGRPHYRPLEEIAGQPEIIGRAALFEMDDIHYPGCLALLSRSLRDPR